MCTFSFVTMQIVYMDHLDFPPLQAGSHIIDYSLPRACHVRSADFELAMAIDKNRTTLEPNVFGKRPVSNSERRISYFSMFLLVLI